MPDEVKDKPYNVLVFELRENIAKEENQMRTAIVLDVADENYLTGRKSAFEEALRMVEKTEGRWIVPRGWSKFCYAGAAVIVLGLVYVVGTIAVGVTRMFFNG